MKQEPDYDWENVLDELDKSNRRMTRAAWAVVGLLLILFIMICTSCTAVVEPTGRRTYSADPNAFLIAIETWAAMKAVPVDK